jgi:hypothetical protein
MLFDVTFEASHATTILESVILIFDSVFMFTPDNVRFFKSRLSLAAVTLNDTSFWSLEPARSNCLGTKVELQARVQATVTMS